MVYKIYGVSGSQPCRSVEWLLLIKGIDFEEIATLPGAPTGTKNPEYLHKNPAGTVPLLDDEGFLVWESNAIMAYLSNKHSWEDMYPKDFKHRAIVDQWLHWHHQNSRQFTIALFAPVLRPDLKISPESAKKQQAGLHRIAHVLNVALEGKNYIANNRLSIADICLYGDIGQFDKQWIGQFDFEKYGNLNRWLQNMKSVPKYEEAHQIMPAMVKMFNKGKARAGL